MSKRALQIAILLSGSVLITFLNGLCSTQNTANTFGFSLDSDLEMLQAGQHITPPQAAQFEAQLNRNPDDFRTRALLTAYYYRHAIRQQRLKHALWMIEHHPDSELLRSSAFIISAEDSPVNDMASYERAKALWLAISQKADHNPQVLWNASSFIIQFDPARTEQLALAGKVLEPSNRRWNERLAFLYAKAVFTEGRMRPQMPSSPDRDVFAQKARRELETSSDPDLIGLAGNSLAPADPQVRACRSPEDISFGLRLLERARQLAPNDPRWRAYLQTFLEPSRNEPDKAEVAPDASFEVAKHAEPGTLLRKVEPAYASEALRSGIQGPVRLRILIGTDDHVLNVWLISGQPLLYASAYQAVRRWQYEPLRVGDDPTEAYRVLELQFHLPHVVVPK